MAAQKPKSVKGAKPTKGFGSKPAAGGSKSKKSGPPPKTSQVKSRPTSTRQKPKRRMYSEKELEIPKLNMITPAGVTKPRGKKKGKVFVDDQESMMTILAMVNAEKEGEIESKIMKARQMEEIREARRQEAEARQDHKRVKFEETKDAVRKNRKKKPEQSAEEAVEDPPKKAGKPNKKRVSFG